MRFDCCESSFDRAMSCGDATEGHLANRVVEAIIDAVHVAPKPWQNPVHGVVGKMRSREYEGREDKVKGYDGDPAKLGGR